MTDVEPDIFLPTPYLTPALLRCSYYNGYVSPPSEYAVRTVYEYELEYYLRSEGGIRVNGTLIPFHGGDINIRKPGQVVQGLPPYECYILVVDLVGNTNRAEELPFGTAEEAQPRYRNPLLDNLPDRLVPEKKDLIAGLMESIFHIQNSTGDLAEFQIRSNLYLLFSELFRQCGGHNLTGNTRVIRQAIRHIREHFTEPISIDRLIAESGLSRTCFHRRFAEETGMSPGQLVISLRIEQAKNLLSFTCTPVGEIGALCGYPDHVYFSRIFHRQTGMSPTAFRHLTEK